jgi:hypothetical protein
VARRGASRSDLSCPRPGADESVRRRLKDPDRNRARRVMEAMLGMKKLDITGLERAYRG